MEKPKILATSGNGKPEKTDRFRKWNNQKYYPLPKMEKPKILSASENGKTEKTDRFPVGTATEEQYAALGILLRLLGRGTVRVAVFRLRRPLLHYSPL